MLGLLLGGTIVYFVGMKLVNRASAIWEYNASQQKAQAFLDCLKVIDRGTTNNFSKFQFKGRMVLSNYIQEIQKIKNEDCFSMFTNSPTYEQAQKYLVNRP
ncbi:MAG TPA: hypothetical protein VIK59_07435 [Verrucomicrobiae bacterium]